MYENIMITSILVPFVGAFLLLLVKEKVREVGSVILLLISFFLGLFLINPILSGFPIHISFADYNKLIALNFVGDGIGLIFALIFSLIGAIALFYAITYFSEKQEYMTEFYFLSVLTVGSLIGAAYSDNLLLFFVFWEIVTLCTWRLVGFYRNEMIMRIANKTFIILFFASVFMLVGFFMIYQRLGSLNLSELKRTIFLEKIDPKVLSTGLFFIFIGVLAKAATLPLHIWLSDAHSVAPTPMSAILSGIVVKLGILGFARIFFQTFQYTPSWVLYLSVISSIIAGGAAYLEKDIKKIIAYSTVSQLTYMYLGIGAMIWVGIVGGMLYFVTHSLSKAGLFLSAGIVEKNTEQRDITKLGGLIKTMPFTAIGFLLCGLSIIGLAPFGGFFSKIMVIYSVIGTGRIFLGILAIFSSILTLLYMFRLFNNIFLGEQKIIAKEKSPQMVLSVMILGGLVLLIGIFITLVLPIVNTTAGS